MKKQINKGCHFIYLIVSILIVFLTAGLSFCQEKADLVLLNGEIFTADAENHFAQAVAVKDSIIIKVGSNDLIKNYVGDTTTVYNLHGRLVTPGLIDAHNHMVTAGENNSLVLNLMPPRVQSIADLQRLITGEVAQKNDGEWINGQGFFNLTDGRMPNRYDLDEVAPNNPVYIVHLSGHMAVANSLALQIAGVDSSTASPAGGVVEKDSLTGEPTGVLLNHYAMVLVKKFVPGFSTEEYRQALEPMYEYYHDHGITSIEDVNVGLMNKLMAYKEADSLGALSVRTTAYLTAEVPQTVYTTLPFLTADTARYETPMLKFGGYKLLVDGYAPMSYCYEPTNGFTWNMGTWDPDTLKKVVSMIHDAGYQLAIHCIGDHAIDMAIDAIEYAQQKNPRPDPRHRLEHCFIPTQEELQRIKALGIVVSVQPGAFYRSGESYRYIFGEEREARMFPIKTMVEMGIPLAFGSDYPTEPDVDPQLTLQEAIVRKTQKGHEIGPNERIDRMTALKIHTLGSAYANFAEDRLGSIEEGKLADMAVWSGDYFTVPVSEIKDLTFDAVIIGGTVYKNSATGIESGQSPDIPFTMQLFQNYPNPFNPVTTIGFTVKEKCRVLLDICDLQGRKIKTLVNASYQPGSYTVNFTAHQLASGVYFCRIHMGNFIAVRKMLLLR